VETLHATVTLTEVRLWFLRRKHGDRQALSPIKSDWGKGIRLPDLSFEACPYAQTESVRLAWKQDRGIVFDNIDENILFPLC